MERVAYQDLLAWKVSDNRKPLLVQGARQVGKTYLIHSFGQAEYKHFWYLNFEQNPALGNLFQGVLDPVILIENISLFFGKKIVSKDTLIFFDEIQMVPEAITSLKYFQEMLAEFHIIAAGSLLGVSIGQARSFPVGKVNFLTLYPMSFYEYLLAIGEQYMADNISRKKDFSAIPNLLHEKLLRHAKRFFFLGGMPEVIKIFIKSGDFTRARAVQKDILEAYSRDFSKYANRNVSIKISQVWRSIPAQLAKENKKFKYSLVKKKARAAYYEDAIHWLQKAGLIIVVNRLRAAKIPLSGYRDTSMFKIYLFDFGLLGAMLDVEPSIIINGDELFAQYNGAFIENFVAVEMQAYGLKELFYWSSNNKAEVDFVIQLGNVIRPIEVKSGKSKNLKSIRVFQQKYKSKEIYRISPQNFMQANDFVNIPLYAIQNVCK